jgi:hypothetical protein
MSAKCAGSLVAAFLCCFSATYGAAIPYSQTREARFYTKYCADFAHRTERACIQHEIKLKREIEGNHIEDKNLIGFQQSIFYFNFTREDIKALGKGILTHNEK